MILLLFSIFMDVTNTYNHMPLPLKREEIINRFNSVFNNKYDYSKFKWHNSCTKGIIICPIHGEFIKNYNDHYHKKSGCPRCSSITNLEDFIKKAIELHGNKFDYSLFKYKGAKVHSNLKCVKHNLIFSNFPNNILNPKNTLCPECSREKDIERNRNDHKYETIERLKSIHKNKYSYPEDQDFHFDSKNKIKIICPQHGEFKQNIVNHCYRGNGCEKCGNNKLSKGEKNIEKLLITENINHIREHTFDDCINPETGCMLVFDFYLPEYNTCVEYDGRQHFQTNDYFKIGEKELLDIKKRDAIKNEYCFKNNINLIRISYLEFHKIENKIINGIQYRRT